MLSPGIFPSSEKSTLKRAALIFVLLTVPLLLEAQTQVIPQSLPTEIVASALKKSSNATIPGPGEIQKESGLSNRDTLNIGAVSPRLGDAKGVVLAALRSRYDLLEIGGPMPDSVNAPDDWLVQDKGHKTPADKVPGTRRFQLGKLTTTSSAWTSEDREYSGQNVAEIICTLAAKFVSEGNGICRLQTWSSRQQPGPGPLEFPETRISCGPRQIQINLSWQSEASWVQVNETLYEPAEIPPLDAMPGSPR